MTRPAHRDPSDPGSTIGYVDAQLLAATRLTSDAKLWTRDKGLSAASARLGLTAAVPQGS